MWLPKVGVNESVERLAAKVDWEGEGERKVEDGHAYRAEFEKEKCKCTVSIPFQRPVSKTGRTSGIEPANDSQQQS